MDNSENKLYKRIRNLERLSFSIIMFVLSTYSILNPEQVFAYYGDIGLIISLTSFFTFYLFSTIYFMNLTGVIIEDTSSQITKFCEIYKPFINKLKVPLIVIFGVLITRYLFKFEWNMIFGSLTLMLIGHIIITNIGKSTWLKDKLGVKKDEQLELLKWVDK